MNHICRFNIRNSLNRINGRNDYQRRTIGNIPLEPFIENPVPEEIKKVLGLNFRKEFSLFLKRIDVPVYGVYLYYKFLSTNFENPVEIDQFHSHSIQGYFLVQNSVAKQLNVAYRDLLDARTVEILTSYLTDRKNIFQFFKHTGLLDFYKSPFEYINPKNKIRHFQRKSPTFDQYHVYISKRNLDKMVPYYDDSDAMIDTLFGFFNLIYTKHGQAVIDRIVKNFLIPGVYHYTWPMFCEDNDQAKTTIESLYKLDYLDPKLTVQIVEDFNPVLTKKSYKKYTAFGYINDDMIASGSHKNRDMAINHVHLVALVNKLNTVFLFNKD